MHQPHIQKSIGYYLNGGGFVQRHYRQIFVGRIENQVQDLIRLAEVLGIDVETLDIVKEHNKQIQEKRGRATHQTSFRQHFSKLAIRNLRAFFFTDYQALRELMRYGLLSRQAAKEYGVFDDGVSFGVGNDAFVVDSPNHPSRMILDDNKFWMEWDFKNTKWIYGKTI